jgi:hypothetical protein
MMKHVWIAGMVLALGALAFAGAGVGWFDLDAARKADRIEIQVDQNGVLLEVEYEYAVPIPAALQAAFRTLSWQDPANVVDATKAEREWRDGTLYYKLLYEAPTGGLSRESLLASDGQHFVSEIQVLEADVPEPVRATITEKYPQGTGVAYEQVMDAAGNTTEYHVKLTEGGRKHKVIVQPNGVISGSYFEVVAELEVPAPPR